MNTSKKLKIALLSSAAVLVLSLGALTACGGEHTHTLQAHEAVAATCTEDGHTAYWSCIGCDELFADANGETTTTLEEVTLAALGHNTVAVAAKEATCTEDGCAAHYTCERCGMNFSDEAATQVMEDAIIRRYNHDQLTEVQAVEATPESDGNVYHWHCARCGKNFTSRNTNQEIENVVIPKLTKETGLTINVTTYGADGSETTAPTGTFTLEGTQYSYSDADDVTISDGKLSVTALYADEYVLSIDGYYPVYFTVESGTKEYDVDLYEYFHEHTVSWGDSDKVSYDYIDGDLQIKYNDVEWLSEAPIVSLEDENIQGSNYMLEFTLQFQGIASLSSWQNRFSIRLGTTDEDKAIGLMFFGTDGEFRCAEAWTDEYWFGDGSNYNPFQPFASGTEDVVDVNQKLLGDGLRVRAGRSGDLLTVSMYVSGRWVKIWEANVTDLGTGVMLQAVAPGGIVRVSEIDYFTYVPSSSTHNAHFESNGSYYTLAGEETTLDDLKISELQGITVNVTVYDGLGNLTTDTNDIALCLEDTYGRLIENVEIVDGVLSVSNFYAGNYTITGNGVYTSSLTIVEGTEEYSITIYLVDDRFEIVNNDTRVTTEEVEGDLQLGFDHIDFNAYNPPVVLLKDDSITGSDYMVEFAVKYDFDEGSSWNWMQRFGIRLGTSSVAETTFGISFFAAGDSELHVSLLAVGDNGFGERQTLQPLEKGSAEATAFCSALKGDGVTFRAVRNGDKLYLRAYLNGEWVLLYEVDAAGLGTGIAVSASANNSICYVSDISYADGYVAETEEMYAHFVKDDGYITADGLDTTAEELAVKKVEGLTINVTVYDSTGEENSALAPDSAFMLYGEFPYMTENGVTITDGKLSVDALYRGKYIIFIDGYLPATFTISSDITEYDVRLDVNDKHSAVSVDENTGDVTFDHLAWNGGSFVTLEDEAVSGSNYMVEFTVKYDFDEGASWDWTQRFALMIGMSPVDEKPIGLMFFAAGDAEIHAANAVSNDIRWFGEGHEGFTITGGNAEQIAAALKGDGLRVRAVRNGDTLTVYFLLGSEWTEIWTKTAEGLSAYVGVTATSPNSKCIVSDISFGLYVAETTDTAAHLVNGDIVYTLDGVQTTLDALQMQDE